MSATRENKISVKRKTKTPSSDARTVKGQKRKRSDIQPQNNDDEEDFPRGGSNTLTPLEVRQIRDEAEKDVLFGTPASSSRTKVKTVKSKKQKQKSDDNKESTNDSLIYVTKDTRAVESLSFKKLAKGVLLLGVVQEVFDFELLISLPNNLSGYVNITNINKVFTSQLEEETAESEDAEHKGLARLQKFFPVGTIVRCVVVSIDTSKHGHSKVRLSVDPTDVNSSLTPSNINNNMVLSGYVTSIEDHGYAVSLGVDKISGFLSKKNASGELCIGQVVECLVISTGADKRLVQLQCDNDKINSAIASLLEKYVFSSLLPGTLINASVKEVSKSGLVVTFLGGFYGSLDLIHLKDHGGSGENLEETYPCKTKILSRIIYICPSTKTIGLSELQNLVDNKPSSFPGFSIGDVMEEATVMRLDQSMGVLLRLSDKVSGFAHISRLSDQEHITKIDKKFKTATKHSCRILSFNTLVGLALVTLEKSVIEEPFIRYQDIKPGVVITGQVQCLLKTGMLVSLSNHIRGFCSSIHFADVLLKHPEKKLQDGNKIKCRVLDVDPERKRLRLTHKKTLVQSELIPITDYSEIKLGMKTHGFITSIRDYGCIVHFYNNIHGLVPKAELGLKASENPHNAFYVGQVVTCVVISCSEKRLALSFNTTIKPSLLNTKALTPGTFVDIDIVGKADSGLDVQIKPSNTPAFLSRMHLSDHVIHCGLLLKSFSPCSGENEEVKSLSNVLYYGRQKDKTHVISLKQSLMKMATEGSLVEKFEDLQVGMILPGFVRKHMPYGVFIEFSPNVYGLAPNSLLADKYISDSSQYFKTEQSVYAKITEIDSDLRRFLVSLKQSDCFPEEESEKANDPNRLGIDLLEEHIQERDKILENLQSMPENDGSFISILPGSIVTAKVTVVLNYGLTLLLEGGVEGFAPSELIKGVNASVGEVFDVLVFDYDIEKKRVYVTADSNTIKEWKEINIGVKKKKIKPGVVVPVTVQMIYSEYMVVLLPKHGFQVAYVPVKEHLNDIRDPASRFTIGQSCNATAQIKVSSKLDKRNYLIVTVDTNNEKKNTIQPGEIVTGVVKSVKDVQMNVQLFGGRYHGRVHVTEILDDPVEGTNPLTVYKCGEKVQVRVLGFRDSKSHNFLPITHRNFTKAVAELSTRSSRLLENTDKTEEGKPIERQLVDYKEGENILCFVKSIRTNDIWMSASTSVDGRVGLLDISTDIMVLQNLSSHFKVGTAHRCTVLSVDVERKSLNLSMLGCDVKKGEVVVGKIRKINPNTGLGLYLPQRKGGMVFLTDLNDRFKENPIEGYSVDQLVSCHILAVKDDGQIDLSTRASKTKGTTTEVTSCENDKDVQALSDIEEGDIVRGYIKRCSDVGVFVSLSRHIVARVQIKNLSHYFVKKWKPFFPVGKLVKGKVLSIDPTSNFIELSLKGKDIGGDDPVPKPQRKTQPESKDGKRIHENSESEDEGISLKKHRKEDEVEETSDLEQDSDIGSSKDSSDDDNELSGGFDWNSFNDEELPTAERAATDSDDENASEVEESTQVVRKKSKRAKSAAKKAEEEFLYKTEQALINKETQTAEDFDRVLLATPNDSLLWLQYMAFNLHVTEVDKARAVAERALKSISFREESEKFNVWVALLNLENSYGTQESLVDVFQRALQQNEPREVFKQLVNIYIKSNKFQLAEQLYQTMLKRFKSSKKVWIDYASYLMERGEVESARNVLQRSLKSLEKRKHIETITRFAMLEFKHGEPERGRTLFDNILTSYPKRTDIWSMYVDVLTRNGDIPAARRLLERAATLTLSSKKIKFIFKKYLEFEKKHGDSSGVESVKKMAEEYVREKTG